MDTRAQPTEALVLRTLPYGDADLIVHLLARGRGRVSAFARGARRSRDRFAGALEPFATIEAMLLPEGRSELVPLRSASPVQHFAGLRDDLSRLAHAGHAAELLWSFARPGSPADELLDLGRDFLSRLSNASATSARLRAFELLVLAHSGLSPDLDRCARCGQPLSREACAVDPGAGGAVCPRCAPAHAVGLGVGSRLALLQLQQTGLAGADAPLAADGSGRQADLVRFEDACRQAAPALAALIAHQLGHPLRSASFFRQVGAPP